MKAWQPARIGSLLEAGAKLADCFVVEIFSGSARVTASLKQMGMPGSFGVDRVRSKSCVGPTSIADLTTSCGQELLFSWLRNRFVVGAFLAPPGTASRGRFVPLNKKRRFGRVPRLLRTDRHPNGVPGLNHTEQAHIGKANILDHLTSQVVRFCIAEGIIVVVENPQCSHFWSTTFWHDVAHLLDYAVVQLCQYGSSRPKKILFAFSHHQFRILNRTFPGMSAKHKHAKWGRMPRHKHTTAEAIAYPVKLAKEIAMCFVQACTDAGLASNPNVLAEVRENSVESLAMLRAQAGVQPKASRLPPLLPIFEHKWCVHNAPRELYLLDLHHKCPQPLHVLNSASEGC